MRIERTARDIDRELSFNSHSADDLQSRGRREEDAEYEARRRLGNRTLMREHTRNVDVFKWLITTFTDAITLADRWLRVLNFRWSPFCRLHSPLVQTRQSQPDQRVQFEVSPGASS